MVRSSGGAASLLHNKADNQRYIMARKYPLSETSDALEGVEKKRWDNPGNGCHV